MFSPSQLQKQIQNVIATGSVEITNQCGITFESTRDSKAYRGKLSGDKCLMLFYMEG